MAKHYHAYKAITTKFVPATNTRGARIKALAHGFRGKPNTITIAYPHEANSLDAHAEAAEALCRKMFWSGELVPGATYDENYVWVFVSFKDART